MSVPKYITELSKFQKKLKVALFFTVIITLILWIIHVSIELPSNPLIILFYPELYIFWGALIGYAYFYIRWWKEMIYNAENDLYETIVYRDKTSLKNLAQVKKLKEKSVEKIVQRLIDQEKLFGLIRDGLYIAEITAEPICAICNKEITDKLLMVLCPFCKRPFHKDHIIDYLNEMENKCPNCKNPLGLADIIR